MAQVYTGSATWNPADLASLDELTVDVTVTGAALGDFAEAAFNIDVAGLEIGAAVTAANVVTVSLKHHLTGGNVNLAVGTLYVKVTSQSGRHF